jgi:hypothetical protein
MEEPEDLNQEIFGDKNFYDRNSINNVLQELDKNRRISPGYNNFRPNDEMPANGNPYPKNSLAGKFMDPMNEEDEEMMSEDREMM